MSDKKYNGWTNYETWCVNLWLTNEEPSYRDLSRLARTCDSVDELVDEIKEMVDGMTGELSGFVADLVRSSLDEVDWEEIAKSAIEGEDRKIDEDGNVIEEEEKEPKED